MKAFLEELNRRRLRSTEDPGLLKEHYGIEQTVLAGGQDDRFVLSVYFSAPIVLSVRHLM